MGYIHSETVNGHKDEKQEAHQKAFQCWKKHNIKYTLTAEYKRVIQSPETPVLFKHNKKNITWRNKGQISISNVTNCINTL